MPRIEEDRRLATHRVSVDTIRAAAEGLAERHPEIQAVWLFGSYARGEERRTSDVDLAVMTAPDLADDLQHRFDLRDTAEQLLDVPVDVVLVSSRLPPALQWEVLCRPRLLWARDATDAAAFASTLRCSLRDDWPRLERRWERTDRWFRELASGASE